MGDVSSVLNPASPQGKEILHLFFLVLGVAAFIFTIVAGLVAYISIRYRHRAGGPEPSQVTENTALEVTWTAIPFLILTVLFIATVRVMHDVDPPPRGGNPDLLIVAHQWWWEVHYPKTGLTTANEIRLPVGKRILIRLKSADVIHDFWVPSLGKKADAIPNHPNHLWLTIDKPGTYLGTCDEFCGAEHAWMRIRVIGQSPADFAEWERRQLKPASPPSTTEAREGERIFHARTCANCHAIAGTSARSTIGPDLTHLASRETLASGVLTNTPDNLAKWLRNPQAVKPGCNMPNLKLPASEVKSLVAYLDGLR